MLSFSLACFQNEFLAPGAGDVHAVITVSASGRGDAVPGAVVMLIDVSGSMQGEKIQHARKAVTAAINSMPDGARFAVVAGNDRPTPLYPRNGLAVASTRTREEAVNEVKGLRAGGGTRIGSWLQAATELLSAEHGVRRAILVTDGKNENETPEELERALADAAPVFDCDCRGVGTDWSPAELRGIAHALKGSTKDVSDPAELVGVVEEMMRDAMDKAVAAVRLRVAVPRGAEIMFVKQVHPEVVELSPLTLGADHPVEYAIGSWAEESRDYHLALQVPPCEMGDEMLAARVTIVVDGEPAGQTPVRAVWTDDNALSTRVNRHVEHYNRQEELSDTIQEALRAQDRGDDDTAIVKLARAAELISVTSDREKGEQLARVTEVEESTGRVVLKKNVSAADRMTLDVHSTRTVRVRRPG